ncbi:MAG: DNA cytosine methyltransferase [Candidatus Nanopelagicales bacterium]
MIRVVDVFAGAGGASLGLRRAGCTEVAAIEYDRAAAATLRAALERDGCDPAVVIEGDVREVASVPDADLWWASPPCQDFSTAGSVRGANGDRNGWPWLLDLVDRSGRPPVLIAENVLGMMQHTAGCAPGCPRCWVDAWLIPEIRKRWAWVDVRVVNAADYGVPQRRRRVILMAADRPLRWPTPTHAEVPGLWGERPWVSMGEALGAVCASVATANRPGVPLADRRLHDLTDRPSLTIGTSVGLGAGHPFVLRPVRGAGMIARHGSCPDIGSDEPAPTITSGGHKGCGPRFVVMSAGITGRSRPQSSTLPAPTLSTKGNAVLLQPALTVCATEAKDLVTGKRQLTVEECAILQGFPADYPWTGSLVQQYRQVGNAVCPAVAEALVRAAMEAT